MEKDSSELSVLFQQIMTDMKAGFPIWEEFTNRAGKLQASLKSTLVAVSVFLETLQKFADFAIGTKGATKDLSTALTRLCLRHRSIETKLKTFTNSVIDSIVVPLQTDMEDWKKTVAQIDRDHFRDYKKARHDLKKASVEAQRLQKKVNNGKTEQRGDLERALKLVDAMSATVAHTETSAVSTALVEHRSRLCEFIVLRLKPVMDQEISMLSEVGHLQEVVDILVQLSVNPKQLSAQCEQVIFDVTKGRTSQYLPVLDDQRMSYRDDMMFDPETVSNASSSSSQLSFEAPRPPLGGGGELMSVDNMVQRQLPDYPVDRAHTISSIYLHGSHTRPALARETFEPQRSNQSTTAAGGDRNSAPPSTAPPSGYIPPPLDPPPLTPAGDKNIYAVSTLQRPKLLHTQSVRVADIHARSSLVSNRDRDVHYAILPVAVPTVPMATLQRQSSVTSDNSDTSNVHSARRSSMEIPGITNEHIRSSPQAPQKAKSNAASLADAIRELEENTAELQMPFDLQSCQSLQCSSGYGTMTNISTGSVEKLGALSELDEITMMLIAASDFTTVDKYCTLPGKRAGGGGGNKGPPTAKRPVSSSTGAKVTVNGQPADVQISSVQTPPDTHAFPGHTSPGQQLLQTSLFELRRERHGTAPPQLEPFQPSSHYENYSDDNLPPPPPLTSVQVGNTRGAYQVSHDDDDFPLPPPPDDENLLLASASVRESTLVWSRTDVGERSGKPRAGSITSGHADIINSLNEKLLTRNQSVQGASKAERSHVGGAFVRQSSSDNPNRFVVAGEPVGNRFAAGCGGSTVSNSTFDNQRRLGPASGSSQASHGPECAAGGDDGSFSSMIQRGISLRRVVSNDRSQPRLAKN